MCGPPRTEEQGRVAEWKQMISKPVLAVAPAVGLVDLATLKKHARVDDNADDALLDLYLSAAVGRVDGFSGILGRCLINQDWKVKADQWQRRFLLPFPSVTAAEITYADTDDVSQTMSADNFELIEDHAGTEIVFGPDVDFPGLSTARQMPITVTFTAGYGAAADDVPWPIRVAVMQMAATWYDQREIIGQGVELPLTAASLLAPFNMVGP